MPFCYPLALNAFKANSQAKLKLFIVEEKWFLAKKKASYNYTETEDKM